MRLFQRRWIQGPRQGVTTEKFLGAHSPRGGPWNSPWYSAVIFREPFIYRFFLWAPSCCQRPRVDLWRKHRRTADIPDGVTVYGETNRRMDCRIDGRAEWCNDIAKSADFRIHRVTDRWKQSHGRRDAMTQMNAELEFENLADLCFAFFCWQVRSNRFRKATTKGYAHSSPMGLFSSCLSFYETYCPATAPLGGQDFLTLIFSINTVSIFTHASILIQGQVPNLFYQPRHNRR